jgi:hypothetical protein
MESFFLEIEKCLEARLYYSALANSLILPDICGSLATENGGSTPVKYRDWYKKYVQPQYKVLTANECYYFRCSFVHQGSTHHPNIRYGKILFVPPGSSRVSLKNVICAVNNTQVIFIDLEEFCQNMVIGGRKWFGEIQSNAIFIKNYPNVIKYYENGLPPFVVGIPVIG